MAFLESILKGAVSEQLRTGVPWQVTLSQAAVETEWGKKTPMDIYSNTDSNNLFGIKYVGSPSDDSSLYVRAWTREHINDSDLVYWEKEQAKWALNGEGLENTGQRDNKGKLIIKVIQPFRTFSSKDDSIIEHSKTLDKPIYDEAKQYQDDPYKYLETILPIYATGSEYYNSAISIIYKYMDWYGKDSKEGM